MILVKKISASVLTILLLFSGCTQLQQEQEGEQKEFKTADRTTSFVEISVSSKDISPGRTVSLQATIQNNNVLKAEDVVLELRGVSPLQIEGGSSFLDSSQKTRCEFEELGPALSNYGGDKRLCRWVLKCPEGSECENVAENFKSYNVPITLNLKYSTELTNPDESVSVEYLPLPDMKSAETQQRTYRAENGDLKLTAEYDSPEPIDSKVFSPRISLTNTGKGEMTENGLALEYAGLLANYLSDTSRCDSLVIPEDSSSVSTTCSFPISGIEANNVYKMKIRGKYKYSKEETIEIEITYQ